MGEMIRDAFAIIGFFVVARIIFRELLWRATRDPNGNSGRFGHWESGK